MIYLDVTKTGKSAHRSGLMRVTGRLLAELGPAATPVRWGEWDRAMRPDDWFLTAELFSEAERPGLGEFLRTAPGRKAAVFPDAIPLKFPHITWPHSVARHPGYMKLLASFDHVWGISATVRDELVGFWRWQGLEKVPPVEVLTLGSDFDGSPRLTAARAPRPPGAASSLLCVGILEPRKNQTLLLDACEELWAEGLAFDLHVVGRVNPHFGAPVVARIRELSKRFRSVHHHEGVGDAELARLYAEARATVFPTIAEGCGLPLLESLWRGVPCVCSDLPVLMENAGGGGCLAVAVNDRAAWRTALRQILTDDATWTRLATEARTRPLPTWAETAATLRARLGAPLKVES